jgi:signal transduction histidine kinase
MDAIIEDSQSTLNIARVIKAPDLDAEILELVEIDTLVSTAIQRIVIPPGIEVHNKCEQNLPQILALSGSLVDALENFIRNGLEAIDRSGSVTVVARKLVKEAQEWVAVQVKDTGRGIPPEDLPEIFELFFTTKPGGMGFALWRANTLIESLGGSIEVSSEVGKGTSFTILLPAA